MRKKNGTLRQRIFSVILTCTIILVIGVVTFVVLAAFWELESASEKIKSLFVASTESLQNTEVGEDQKEVTESYLERIKAACTEALQAHTTSFLFQIFSVALLSGGSYLILRYKKEVEQSQGDVHDLRRQVSHMGEYAGSTTASVALAIHAMTAVQTAYFRSSSEDSVAFTTEISLARELLLEFKKVLTMAKEDKCGMDESQHAILLDQTRNILETVKRIAKDPDKDVRYLLETATDCDRLLKTSDFVKRHKSMLSNVGKEYFARSDIHSRGIGTFQFSVSA